MQPTIRNVMLAATAHFGVSVEELIADRRRADLVRCRHVAMTAAKRLTALSLPVIGRAFRRDHSAVLHAVKKVERLIGTDACLAEDLDEVERLAKSGGPARSGEAIERLIAAVRRLELQRFTVDEALAVTEVIQAGRACRAFGTEATR